MSFKITAGETQLSVQQKMWEQQISYDQGQVGANMLFAVVCKDIPVGSTVTFSCPTPGPTPPIYLPKTIVSNSISFIAGIFSNVPAGYSGVITIQAELTAQLSSSSNIYIQVSFQNTPQ